MTIEGTLVETWTWTFDEAAFCPPIYSVRHIYSIKRKGATEGIVLFLMVTDKNREEYCGLYLLR
jgi:hypothetical protein